MDRERPLNRVESDIEKWTRIRAQAIQTLEEADVQLQMLAEEKGRVLGRVASRHLYVVPTVTENPRPHPDGVA